MVKLLKKTASYILIASITTLPSLGFAAEQGLAAYYSNVFHGRKTASGALYNKNKLTAAHKTLKFGTKVKVTALNNNKSVVVTITDRGPFTKDRVIDLSLAAAKQIDLVKAGITKVKLEIIE